MTAYTSPERFTERVQCKRKLAKILQNACGHCRNRDPLAPAGFETCQLFGRRYPMCASDGRALTFELDESTLEAK